MPAGRPSKFKPEMVRQVALLCAKGFTDPELAQFFEVDESTISNWKIDHPEFLEALKAAKQEYDDAIVEQSLARRASGFVRTVERLHDGVPIECREEVPPDTTACIFWLKNRQPSKWRDKQEVEHSGELKTAVLEVATSAGKPSKD